MNLGRLVPVLMTSGSNLGKCRKLTSVSWRTELEFAPQLFWIQSSTTDACHSSRRVRIASLVMLIDLFKSTVRTVTLLHLNTCSKLRDKNIPKQACTKEPETATHKSALKCGRWRGTCPRSCPAFLCLVHLSLFKCLYLPVIRIKNGFRDTFAKSELTTRIRLYINGAQPANCLTVYPGLEKVCRSSFSEATPAAGGVSSDTWAILTAGV